MRMGEAAVYTGADFKNQLYAAAKPTWYLKQMSSSIHASVGACMRDKSLREPKDRLSYSARSTQFYNFRRAK
jgi:hypothetical protein